jgi:flagellar protein FlaG
MAEVAAASGNSLKNIGPKIQRIQNSNNGPVNSDKKIDISKSMDLQRTQTSLQNTGSPNKIDTSSRERSTLALPKASVETKEFEIKGGPGTGTTRASGGPGAAGKLGDQPVAPPEAAKASPEKFGFQKVIEDNIPVDLKQDRVLDVDRFRQRLDRSVDTLNRRMEELGRSVRFSRDQESNREIISVVNPESGDLIRQIPTENAIRVSEGLKSMRGMLFDDKA